MKFEIGELVLITNGHELSGLGELVSVDFTSTFCYHVQILNNSRWNGKIFSFAKSEIKKLQ